MEKMIEINYGGYYLGNYWDMPISIFFVCTQHFSKMIQCYWRHYVLRGDQLEEVGCIYVATLLAELFETPSRRIQYILYTSTHIIRIIKNANN